MKRKIAWLALPLVLIALVSDADARVKRPKPTKLDLRIRELMLQSDRVEVISSKNYHEYHVKLSKNEFRQFVDNFYLSSNPNDYSISPIGAIGLYRFDCKFRKPRKDKLVNMVISILIDSREGNVFISRENSQLVEYKIHPVAVKSWIELLLAHSRIGPELRARMKQ